MFYLTMHSTHFIYSYMASDIWLKIKRRKERMKAHKRLSDFLNIKYKKTLLSHYGDEIV